MSHLFFWILYNRRKIFFVSSGAPEVGSEDMARIYSVYRHYKHHSSQSRGKGTESLRAPQPMTLNCACNLHGLHSAHSRNEQNQPQARFCKICVELSHDLAELELVEDLGSSTRHMCGECVKTHKRWSPDEPSTVVL